MCEDRLEALVLMQAHRGRVTELAINDITDKFAACRSLTITEIFISTLMLLSFTDV